MAVTVTAPTIRARPNVSVILATRATSVALQMGQTAPAHVQPAIRTTTTTTTANAAAPPRLAMDTAAAPMLLAHLNASATRGTRVAFARLRRVKHARASHAAITAIAPMPLDRPNASATWATRA